jgi:hypothetical protein
MEWRAGEFEPPDPRFVDQFGQKTEDLRNGFEVFKAMRSRTLEDERR